MLVFAGLLSTLFSVSVAASPTVIRDSFVRLPFAKHVNRTGIANLLANDLARAAALQDRSKKVGHGLVSRADASDILVTNQAVIYVASVNVGNQASPFSLIVDTGSSNTWVGASQRYTSTTGTNTGQPVSVTYGSGLFRGTEFVDTVDLGNGLVISQQSFGNASTSQGFSEVDGILGIGPVALTLDTLTRRPTTTIPTITDNLFSQDIIPNNEVSVSFEPTTSLQISNGELTFGGTDSSKFTGSLTFAPLTTTSPSNQFWGIDQSITYGTTNTSILKKTAGIVDTGTTLVLIASDAFNRYQKATGATNDPVTGLLALTTAQFANLQSLNFNVGTSTFELTANAQAWPRTLNADIGGNSSFVYLIVGSIGTPTGSGLDFINCQTFLERFYSVFDTSHKMVGFAPTPFTTATTN